MTRRNGLSIGEREWLRLDEEGVVAWGRIVAVGQVASAPIRRLIQATPPSQVVVLTGGRRRQTVLVLDSGHLVISALSVAEIMSATAAYQDKLLLME